MATVTTNHQITGGNTVPIKPIEELSGLDRLETILQRGLAKNKRKREIAKAPGRYREYLKNLSSARKTNPLKLKANYSLTGPNYSSRSKAFNAFINGGHNNLEILQRKLHNFIRHQIHSTGVMLSSLAFIQKTKLEKFGFSKEKSSLDELSQKATDLVQNGIYCAIEENRGYLTSVEELKSVSEEALGIINNLKTKIQDEEILEDLATMENGYQELPVMIDAFYRRLEADRIVEEVYIQPINLQKGINKIVNYARTTIRKRNLEENLNIQLNTDLNNLDLEFYTDPHKLTDILVNLIDNAIEELARAKVSGEIKLNIEASKSELCFKVSNPGEIPKDLISNIFNDEVTGPEKVRNKGNVIKGSGLTIAKKYAQMLDGDIVLESSENPVIFSGKISNKAVDHD